MRWLMIIMLMVISIFGDTFLKPSEAFKPKIISIDNNSVKVKIELGSEIYLFADKLKIEDADPKDHIEFVSIKVKPEATLNEFNEEIYTTSPSIEIVLTTNKKINGNKKVRIKLFYQGVDKKGLLYEPEQTILEVDVNANQLSSEEAKKMSFNKDLNENILDFNYSDSVDFANFGFLMVAIMAIVGIAIFCLWIWALVDIIKSDFKDVVVKILWFLLVLFIPLLGFILYVIIGKSTKLPKGEIESNIKYEDLARIKSLYDSGAISEAEFEAEKRKILG